MESLWNKRKARFEILSLAIDADETWGPLGSSGEVVKSLTRDAEVAKPEYRERILGMRDAALEENSRALDRHMNDHWQPAFEAAMLVARTPAPDLEALRFKQELMTGRFWLEGEAREGELFALFMADVTRLAGEVAE